MNENANSRITARMNPVRTVVVRDALRYTSNHRRLVALSLLSVLFVAAGWLFFRRVPHVPAIVGEWAREAQETASSWPVASIDAASGREAASEFLASRLPDDATDSCSMASLESGVSSIVAFLAAKQLGTFDEYTSWAHSQGFSIRRQWPDTPRFKEEVYQGAYRRSLDIQDKNYRCTPTEFFRDIYKHNHTASDGSFIPVGISTGNDAAHIQVATFTHHADSFDYEDDLTARPPGIRFWVGGSSWSWLRFTEPPNTMKDIIDKHGEATVMRVLLLTVGPTGLKMPTDIYQCYDPDRKQWFVYNVMQYNLVLSAGLGLKEDTWFVY